MIAEGSPPTSSAPRRVTMPCRWAAAGLGGLRGMARFQRKFGYPGRIDPGEHIWLTCAGCSGCRQVRLNGQLLGEEVDQRFAFEVTTVLSERNQLEVMIQGDADDAGLWGEVALEIRRDAYLADLALQRTGAGVQITGSAVGTAPRPLELYTLVDDRHADYRMLEPLPAGQPFQIDLPGLSTHHQTIRVELIHVSSIWYAAELVIQDWFPDPPPSLSSP